MAKQSGLGDNFYIGGYDLSGNVASLEKIGGGPALLDVTPVNASAHVRLGALRDGGMQFTSFFDTAAGAEHPALSTLPRTDTVASYFRGTTLLNPAACVNGKQINYDPTRDNTGNLTIKAEVQANIYGLEWGKMITAGLRTDGTATTGAAVDDNGAGSSNGAQAYLQLVSLTGTNVDVSIQHCTTSNGSYANLIDFGTQTGRGSYRGTVSGTVNRFLEVVTGGTFTSCTFAVAFMRNPVAVTF